MGKTILEMIDIKKSFSGIYALSGINFSLEMGEVHALLGENGAGKSTLIKVLGGIYKPDSGTIKINGQEVEINGVSDAQEKGIGIIHQEIVLVPYLTVAQNLFLGREIKTKFGTVDMRETNRRAGEMLANLGVNIHPDTLVESLTIAQQQMVEIVKAVSFDGRIIVMDEPTSSLSNDEVEQLFGIIERLKAKQVSIIYISHRMEELFRISDRVTIIRDGAYVGTKKTSETNANELVAMMVGRELESFYARDYNDLEHAETALEVKNLTCEGVFSDISFRVRKGEILGFAGLVGAGRSEIWFAMVNTSSGEISGWFRHWQWSFKNSRTLRSRTKRMLWERWAMSSFERLERSARVTGTLFMRMPRLLIPSPFTSCSMSFMRRLFPAPVFPAMAQSSPGWSVTGAKCSGSPALLVPGRIVKDSKFICGYLLERSCRRHPAGRRIPPAVHRRSRSRLRRAWCGGAGLPSGIQFPAAPKARPLKILSRIRRDRPQGKSWHPDLIFLAAIR